MLLPLLDRPKAKLRSSRHGCGIFSSGVENGLALYLRFVSSMKPRSCLLTRDPDRTSQALRNKLEIIKTLSTGYSIVKATLAGSCLIK